MCLCFSADMSRERLSRRQEFEQRQDRDRGWLMDKSSDRGETSRLENSTFQINKFIVF